MKQLKAFIGLFVIVAGFYVAWKALPYYYANMELQDYVESQARIESYSTHTESDIQDIMAKKAKDLEIPLGPEQFHVTKAGSDLTIWAEYDTFVDVPVHPFTLHFRVETKNHKI